MFNTGDVLGWTSPDGDVFTWDFASRASESVFLNYFVPVDSAPGRTVPHFPWIVIPLLVGAGAVLGGWWVRRDRKRAAVPESTAAFESDEGVAHWSPALRALLLHPERELLTAELDELLGISDAQSPETLRARRARIISAVNAEFELLFGYTLIQRDRGNADRRKVIYRLASPPSMVRKLLRDKPVSAQKVSESPPAEPAEARP